MIRQFRLILMVITVLFLAISAQADLQPYNDDVSDPCAGYDSVDGCFWSPMGNGGDYYACYASGALGQQCQDVDTRQGGGAECVSVDRSAHCKCDPRTLKTSGTCEWRAR